MMKFFLIALLINVLAICALKDEKWTKWKSDQKKSYNDRTEEKSR
jgi:hypothetical protein